MVLAAPMKLRRHPTGAVRKGQSQLPRTGESEEERYHAPLTMELRKDRPMTRVALYARCSSDKQREASIDDQFRICREQAKREKWKVVGPTRVRVSPARA